MNAQKLAEKLEAYEQEAYDGGVGLDWLAEIGEHLKFYVKECADKSIEPNFEGFIERVNKCAREMILENKMTFKLEKQTK